jgi:hypothetical protein
MPDPSNPNPQNPSSRLDVLTNELSRINSGQPPAAGNGLFVKKETLGEDQKRAIAMNCAAAVYHGLGRAIREKTIVSAAEHFLRFLNAEPYEVGE